MLRGDALQALARKRHYTDGAALFSALPRRRHLHLLELLVALQTIANFVDVASERGAAVRGRSGSTLALAIIDAVDPAAPHRDYYAEHPWRDDGGYLQAIVTSCQARCAQLPGYPTARPQLLREARLLRTLELEHDPDPHRRDHQLRCAATEAFPTEQDATWFEIAGGASSALPVLALLAAAAEPIGSDDALAAIIDTYSWAGRLGVVLDGYVDQDEDLRSGEWSSIAYYPSPNRAAERVAYLIDRSLRHASQLPRAEIHTLIIAAMTAMYLSHDAARHPARAAATRALGHAGGTTTRLLMPILRLWRIAHHQHDA